MLIEKLRPTDDDLTELDPIGLYFNLQGRMTQEDFALAMGVSTRTFARWLAGQTKPDGVAWRRAGELYRRWCDRPGWFN